MEEKTSKPEVSVIPAGTEFKKTGNGLVVLPIPLQWEGETAVCYS